MSNVSGQHQKESAPWPEKPVYELSIEGVKVALMSDGSVLGWTAGYVNCEPSGSLVFADSGRAWIPKHKNFNSLARQMFRDGDFDELLKFRQERQARKAALKEAGRDLYEALDDAVKDLVAYQVSARMALKSDSRWEGVSELVQSTIDSGRAALAKARGEKS